MENDGRRDSRRRLQINAREIIYLDHAATSWPKPPEVIRAMAAFLEREAGNPGRSGHRLSVAAARAVYEAREAVATFFHASDPLRVIFCPNATYAINLALRGLLRPGDRVGTTGIEHNSVMRPLRALEEEGVELTIVPCGPDASLDVAAMERAVAPGTRLVVVNHASNVTGTILPVAEVAKIAHASGALLLVDTAQTAGCLPIDVRAMGIDLLAFTGHKGLQGPAGTGGLILGEAVDALAMTPLLYGGTGSGSESEEQPENLPDKFESGTLNAVGLVGLHAGIRFVTATGVQTIREREVEATKALLDGLNGIEGATTYGPAEAARRTPVISVRLEGRRVSEVGLRLDEEYGVLTRVGLQCAPAAHRTLGTFPEGTVRLGPGLPTTLEDIEKTVVALREIASS